LVGASSIARFVAGRLIAALGLLLIVSFLIFAVFSATPGDPAQQLLGQTWTPEAGAALRRQLGLNDPVPVQYIHFVGNALRGNFGRSYMTHLPVLGEVRRAFTNSAELASAALLISLAVGVTMGVIAATRRNSWIDAVARVASVFFSSVPAFVLGILAIYLFAAEWRLLPTGGTGQIRHLVLPASTLALFSMASITRMSRATVLEELRQDYVKAARARGIASTRIVVRHALRNAAIPLMTLGGLYAGAMVGTAVITEYVFAWPGLGTLTVTAIQSRDIPTIQGGILAIAATYIMINGILDIAYGLLDPRVHIGGRSA
jgi:peptide/nickel transport system permease protein